MKYIARQCNVATRLLCTTASMAKDFPVPKKAGLKWNINSTFWMTAVGCFGKILLGLCNQVKFYNRAALTSAINERKDDVPLITVCNHTSMFDDPGLIATMLDLKTLINQEKMRWSLAAREICFGNRLTSYICHHGKIIPIERGEGICQQGINFAVEKLNQGGWVQVFPEGKITFDPIRLKWGTGRMILDCIKTPIVLPFYHVGMDDFLPLSKDFYIPFLGDVPRPRINKKITVLFGDPVPVNDVIEKCRSGELNETTARIMLMERIQEAFRQMRETAENLHTNPGFAVKKLSPSPYVTYL